MKSNIMVEQMINPIFEVVAGIGYFDNIIFLQVHTKVTVCSVSTWTVIKWNEWVVDSIKDHISLPSF